MFEIPDVMRPTADGKELAALQSKELTLSTSEKGNFIKVVEALEHKSFDEDQLYDFINKNKFIIKYYKKWIISYLTREWKF